MENSLSFSKILKFIRFWKDNNFVSDRTDLQYGDESSHVCDPTACIYRIACNRLSNPAVGEVISLDPNSSEFYLGQGYYSVVMKGYMGTLPVVMKLFRSIYARDAANDTESNLTPCSFEHEFHILNMLNNECFNDFSAFNMKKCENIPELIGDGVIGKMPFIATSFQPGFAPLENFICKRDDAYTEYVQLHHTDPKSDSSSGNNELETVKSFAGGILANYSIDGIAVVLECIRTLRFALIKGVIHGDIRASNILVRWDKPQSGSVLTVSVLLIDWGSAVQNSSNTVPANWVKDSKGLASLIFRLGTNSQYYRNMKRKGKGSLLRYSYELDKIWSQSDVLSLAVNSLYDLPALDGQSMQEILTIYNKLEKMLESAIGLLMFPVDCHERLTLP